MLRLTLLDGHLLTMHQQVEIFHNVPLMFCKTLMAILLWTQHNGAARFMDNPHVIAKKLEWWGQGCLAKSVCGFQAPGWLQQREISPGRQWIISPQRTENTFVWLVHGPPCCTLSCCKPFQKISARWEGPQLPHISWLVTAQHCERIIKDIYSRQMIPAFVCL